MALISKTQIANMALSNIGARDTIESLDEESVEAKTVKLWYDHARIKTLEAFDWNFARKRQALALDSADPPEGLWEFRYQYPADCVRARKLEQPMLFLSHPFARHEYTTYAGDAVPYDIEISPDGQRKTILTNLDEAVLIYTFNQENSAMFSHFFVTTLSYALSHDIAIKITGKLAIKEEMFNKFIISLNQAAAHDANENVERPPRDAPWIRARM